MTLYEVVDSFLNIAKNVPNINYVGQGDIYSLNTLPNVEYGVFFITQTNHQMSENTITYNLTLFYVDRLKADGSNKLQIQSQGISTLGNIINLFSLHNDEVDIEYDIQYTTFLQRFADECSGVFCNVSITTDNNVGLCGFEYN
jgi:hypothetical protein